MNAALDAGIRRLLRGSSLMLALNLGSALLSLLAAALAGRALGGAKFGIFTFCMAWAAGLVTLCEAGLDGAVERETARERGASPALVVTGLGIKFAIGLLACGAVALAAPSLAGAEAVPALRLAALQAGGLALLGVFNAGFRGRGAFGLIVVAGLLSAATQAIGTFVIVQAGGSETDLLGLAAALAWVQFFAVGALWGGRFGLPFSTPFPAARLVRLALPFLAGVAVRVVQGRIAPLGLAYLSLPLDVGYFGAASRVSDAARLAPNSLLQGAYSLFSTGNDDRRKAFFAYAGAAMLLGSGGALAIVAMGPGFMIAVFGQGFADAGPAVVVLGLAFAPSVIADAAITYLYAVGEAPAAVRLNAAATALQLGAFVLLAGTAGAFGAALAIALSRTITCVPLAALAWRNGRSRFGAGANATRPTVNTAS